MGPSARPRLLTSSLLPAPPTGEAIFTLLTLTSERLALDLRSERHKRSVSWTGQLDKLFFIRTSWSLTKHTNLYKRIVSLGRWAESYAGNFLSAAYLVFSGQNCNSELSLLKTWNLVRALVWTLILTWLFCQRVTSVVVITSALVFRLVSFSNSKAANDLLDLQPAFQQPLSMSVANTWGGEKAAGQCLVQHVRYSHEDTASHMHIDYSSGMHCTS